MSSQSWLLNGGYRLAILLFSMLSLLCAASPTKAFQMFYVDFDSIGDAVDAGIVTPGVTPGVPPTDEIYDYSVAQRAMIIDYLNLHYGRYEMLFVDGLPAILGGGSVVQINSGPAGYSDGVDFRNVTHDDEAKINTIGEFKAIGKMAGDWTDDNVALATANLIAHESGHLMGVRHQDAFGPIGTGIGTFASDFFPSYPGPVGAPETPAAFSSLHTGGHPVGHLSFDTVTTPKFVSERAAVKLELTTSRVHGFGMTEGSTMNHSVGTAEPLPPAAFSAPYPFRDLPDISSLPPEDLPVPVPVSIDGFAQAVKGTLTVASGGMGVPPDYYSFHAKAGQFLTIELMSSILEEGSRYADPVDAAVILLDGTTGVPVPYYSQPFGAFSDDDSEASYLGPALIDVILPPVADTDGAGVGTYVVEVLPSGPFPPAFSKGKPGTDVGSYELFFYSARPTVIFVPEPRTPLLLVMGAALISLVRWRYRRSQLV